MPIIIFVCFLSCRCFKQSPSVLFSDLSHATWLCTNRQESWEFKEKSTISSYLAKYKTRDQKECVKWPSPKHTVASPLMLVEFSKLQLQDNYLKMKSRCRITRQKHLSVALFLVQVRTQLLITCLFWCRRHTQMMLAVSLYMSECSSQVSHSVNNWSSA